MTATVNANDRKAFLAGGGIASLAAAAFLIRDGGMPGKNITIFEEMEIAGGSLDGSGEAVKGYVLRGGRMLNFTYHCTYELLATIPSLTDPDKTVYDEIVAFNAKYKSHSKARLVDRDGTITDPTSMGFSETDRLDLVSIIAMPEGTLGIKRIDEWFAPSFFKTNFWYMWCSMFAFEPWHSAVEFKRYLLRFFHEFPRIDTLAGVDRTPYNQFDSIVRPLLAWLKGNGVRFEMGAQVTDLGFVPSDKQHTVQQLLYMRGGVKKDVTIGPADLVFVTNGSMTANSSLGSMETAPVTDTRQSDGAWALWEEIAKKSTSFGRPYVFHSRIEESKWMSFTTTCSNADFFGWMETFSGNEAGTGGLVTFKDSNWMMSIVLAHQPHFIGQPDAVKVFWGYALFPDKVGNYVNKKMSDCTGAEILFELLSHLHFAEPMPAMILTMNCIPCMMPYITSMFLTRSKGDRPLVIPKGSTNLAFLGQFTEIPDDVVFTVEYSVRSAQMAVYGLLGIDKKPPAIYKGYHDPKVVYDAIKTMHR